MRNILSNPRIGTQVNGEEIDADLELVNRDLYCARPYMPCTAYALEVILAG
jgi:hypothetical protein